MNPTSLVLTIWIVFFGAISIGLYSNLRRRNQKHPAGTHEDLTPNCILTRFPLLFIPGKRSLFYFSEYYNLIPSYLAEHGYDVFKAHLPWSHPQDRIQQLQRLLQQQKTPLHLVLTQQSWIEFAGILHQNPQVRSVTLLDPIDQRQIKSSLFSISKLPIRLWPDHLAWTMHSMIRKDPTPPIHLGLYRNGLKERSAQLEQSLLKKIVRLAEEDLISSQ